MNQWKNFDHPNRPNHPSPLRNSRDGITTAIFIGFSTRSTVSVTNGEQTKRKDVLFKESVRLDSRKNLFTVCVNNKWNELPDEIKGQKSVNGFKNRYNSWKRSKVDW